MVGKGSLEMERFYRNGTKVVIDTLALSLAILCSYLVRFDGLPPLQFLKQLAFISPYIIVLQMVALRLTGISLYSWRYTGLRECQRIIMTLLIPSMVFLGIRLGAPILKPYFPHAIYLQVPIGVIFISW